MGTILLLALAAAVYPQLLAVVVVILTRPNPKPLLWACYLGSLLVTVGTSVAILAIFALLAVPGPFDLIALGHLARGGYGPVEAGAIIIAFALIKFVLIEAPIVGYAIDPAGTATKVHRFSAWMKSNKLAVVAIVVGVIGVALIGTGLSGLS